MEGVYGEKTLTYTVVPNICAVVFLQTSNGVHKGWAWGANVLVRGNGWLGGLVQLEVNNIKFQNFLKQ